MAEQEIKNAIFANNPDLYFELFDEEKQQSRSVKDEMIDFIRPESEEDVRFMMEEIRRSGALD